LGLKGLQSSRPYCMQFTMQAGEDEFYRIVSEEASLGVDPMELVYEKEIPVFEKYDEYVPAELVRKGFALGVLDTESMVRRVMSWRDLASRDDG
ncbi:MAG: ATP-dependent helicase, partial [Firmicutes bacterium]|nr:ATP-dependent helicase [Bacillota bacterium]